MYIEASSPRKPGEKAQIMVTVPNKGKKACLSFYYHMYGAFAGSLNVYNGNDTVFNVSGNQGNRWMIVEKSLHLESEASDVWFLNNELTQNILTASCLRSRKLNSVKNISYQLRDLVLQSRKKLLGEK